MKKYLFIAAAALTLAACNKEQSSTIQSNASRNEIAINAAADKTKGYITGSDFFDTAIEQLHEDSPSTTKRDMRLSAYLTPQAGTPGNYFTGYEYSAGSDEKWHHTPAVYWPVAGVLDFLAYSAKTPFDEKDVMWNEKNSSESVVLNVLEDRCQDDIVYAFAANMKSADGANAVAMKFQHTQAWIEFSLKVATEDMADKIAVGSIIIENAYNRGELTINRTAEPVASWSFRKEQSENIVFEDNYDLYGAAGTAPDYVVTGGLGTEPAFMDMLLPEQPKTSFIIKYFLSGQDKELQYRYDLSENKKNWIMGEKYVYEITFNVNEITVAPTVKAYEEGVVSELTPTELL